MTDTPKILPCPFCGGECKAYRWGVINFRVMCMDCEYKAIAKTACPEAISAHNTVAGKVRVFGDVVGVMKEVLRNLHFDWYDPDNKKEADRLNIANLTDAVARAKELEL